MLYYTYKPMKSLRLHQRVHRHSGIHPDVLIVSQVLEMKLLGSIFDKLVSVGVLVLIILFQEEIRLCFRDSSARTSMPAHWYVSSLATRKKKLNTKTSCR